MPSNTFLFLRRNICFLHGTFVSQTEYYVSQTEHFVSHTEHLFPTRKIGFPRGAGPSESFRTHLGRRSETSITLRLAIFKITLFSSSENESIENIVEREHHFYSCFYLRGATLSNEIFKNKKKHRIINIASSLP